MSKITDIVSGLARPIVEEEGCTLWSVDYLREAGTWFLRVYIDRDGGVSIEDCERISRRLDPILDEKDPIEASYVFEVGSAGADRELKRPSDFEQFMGSDIEVKLYQPIEGSKLYVGKLSAYDADGRLTMSFGKKEISFNKQQMAQVRLHVSIG